MTTSVDERQGRFRHGAALRLLLTACVLDAFDQEAIDIAVSVIFVVVLGLLLLDPRTARILQVIGVVAGSLSVLSHVLAEVLDRGDTYLGVAHITNVVPLAVAIAALIHRPGSPNWSRCGHLNDGGGTGTTRSAVTLLFASEDRRSHRIVGVDHRQGTQQSLVNPRSGQLHMTPLPGPRPQPRVTARAGGPGRLTSATTESGPILRRAGRLSV